jgi:hypothetical protein
MPAVTSLFLVMNRSILVSISLFIVFWVCFGYVS